MTNWRRGRIVFRSDELHVVEAEAQDVDRFLNQISILVASVTELDRRNADEENASTRVTVTRWFEPGVVRMPVNFLLESIEDARPRIRGESCAGD